MAVPALLLASGMLGVPAGAQTLQSRGVWISVADGDPEVAVVEAPQLGLHYFAEGLRVGRMLSIGYGGTEEETRNFAPLFVRWSDRLVSCTGVAVSDRVLLTAAHCLTNDIEAADVSLDRKRRQMHCEKHAKETIAACWLADPGGNGFSDFKPMNVGFFPPPWTKGTKLETASLRGCADKWGAEIKWAPIQVAGLAINSTHNIFEASSNRVNFCPGDSGSPALLENRGAVVATLLKVTSGASGYYAALQSADVYSFLIAFQAPQPAKGKPCTRIGGLPPPSPSCP